MFLLLNSLKYIPKPNEPPPPLPQDSLYDLDVNPNNTASPSRNIATRAAPAIPQSSRIQQQTNIVGTPPPLPKRQNPSSSTTMSNKTQNDLPKIPARASAPPPLPNRPN